MYRQQPLLLVDGMNHATTTRANNKTSRIAATEDDASIISAAQVLLSLAPPQQKRQDQQLHVKAPTATAVPTTTTLSPKSTIVHHLHYLAAPHTTTNRSSMIGLHDSSKNSNTIVVSGAICTPLTMYNNIVPIPTQETGYPKILNVPQKNHHQANSNDANGVSSCASSLDDGSFDEQDDASSTSSSSHQVMLQPRLTSEMTHRNDVTTSVSGATTAAATTAVISYRPPKPQDLLYNTINTKDVFVKSNPIKMKTQTKKIKKIVLHKKHITKMKKPSVPSKRSPSPPSMPAVADDAIATKTATTPVASVTTYYEGSVSLRLKEDELSLSPLHCFMRKCCVEAFTASSEEVTTPRYGKSHGRSISIGQVGIQCVFCKHRPYWLRQERAVCFPSTLKNIYHSIETWQRRHSIVCSDIPTWAKDTMSKLMGKSRSGAGGRRQYWEESAALLGMVDTPSGIRFTCPPGTTIVKQPSPKMNVSNSTTSTVCSDEDTVQLSANSTDIVSSVPISSRHEGTLTVSSRGGVSGKPVVFDEDRELVTDFLFTLLNQMETCYFSEQDRVGGRSKVKDCNIGYPGLQCKHCGGKAGFGRYYPISIQALTSANSDRNIYNHVDKCRRCPSQIRDQLQHHLNEQNSTKNRRGNRKQFFQRIWERMHGPSSDLKSTVSTESICSSAEEFDDDQHDHHQNMEVEETAPFVERKASKQQPIFWQQQQQQMIQNNHRQPMIVVSNNMNDYMKRQPQPKLYQNNNNIPHQPQSVVVYSGYDSVPLQNTHYRPSQQQQSNVMGQQLFQEIQQRYQRQPELWQQHQQNGQHRPTSNISFPQFYQS